VRNAYARLVLVSNAGAWGSIAIPREGTGEVDFNFQIYVFFFHAYNFFHQIQTELEVLSRAEKGGPAARVLRSQRLERVGGVAFGQGMSTTADKG